MKDLNLTVELIMQQLDSKYTKEELIKKFIIADRDLALVSSQYDDLWYEHKEMSCELANLKWDIENGYISSANKSNTLTVSDSEKYILYYGDILDATTGEIVIEQQDLINLLIPEQEVYNQYEDYENKLAIAYEEIASLNRSNWELQKQLVVQEDEVDIKKISVLPEGFQINKCPICDKILVRENEWCDCTDDLPELPF